MLEMPIFYLIERKRFFHKKGNKPGKCGKWTLMAKIGYKSHHPV